MGDGRCLDLHLDLFRSPAFRVAATASQYFRRFYLKNCFCHVDPRLVFVGCVYLASKAEESVLTAKHLAGFMKRCVWHLFVPIGLCPLTPSLTPAKAPARMEL